MKKLLALFFLIITTLYSQLNWSYNWEDGGTALGSYGNAILSNSTEQAHGGTSSLKIVEDPLSGTPYAYIWWVTGLTDADEITASFWVYDITPGASPSGRIWGHYTSDPNDVESYSGSASGNTTYSDGTGWSQVSHTWTFDSNTGANDGLVVEARIYSGSGAGENVIYIDDASITVSNESAIIHAANDQTLPVELTSFTAEDGVDGVLLKWTTESEVENLGFMLERRTAEAEDWNLIASYKTNDALGGQGNYSGTTNYEYIDNLIENGVEYEYRLSDVDWNEVVTHHATRFVTVNNFVLKVIPEKFALFAAYPNPFNPHATIRYDTPVETIVRIAIYNHIGQKVRVLQNSLVQPGEHSVVWDSRDDHGQPMSAGVYFFNIEAGTFNKTHKMILLK